jgi:hypothetical protein
MVTVGGRELFEEVAGGSGDPCAVDSGVPEEFVRAS